MGLDRVYVLAGQAQLLVGPTQVRVRFAELSVGTVLRVGEAPDDPRQPEERVCNAIGLVR